MTRKLFSYLFIIIKVGEFFAIVSIAAVQVVEVSRKIRNVTKITLLKNFFSRIFKFINNVKMAMEQANPMFGIKTKDVWKFLIIGRKPRRQGPRAYGQ